MPRPKSKPELLEAASTNYDRLIELTRSVDAKGATFPEGYLNRNVRDVLAHLHHWHLMFLEWYRVGMKGDKPEMPAQGYTWKTTPDLNRSIQAMYCEMELGTVRRKLTRTHRQLYKIIEQHSQEELFEKKRYKWTGSTSLGAYLISATSSHYHWAHQLIRTLQSSGS